MIDLQGSRCPFLLAAAALVDVADGEVILGVMEMLVMCFGLLGLIIVLGVRVDDGKV